jgi:hypothetical protein
MSATANPYGMIPVLNYGAQYNTQGFESVAILDGYTTAIYFGDVVKLGSDNYLQKDTGTSTLTPYGVFVGVQYIDPSLGYLYESNFWPASTTTGYTTYPKLPLGRVVTYPFGTFQIQANGAVGIADIGKNAAIVQTAGSSVFGRSRNALNASTLDTTDTLPLRVVGIVESPTNAPGDAYTDVLVTFNNTQQILTKTGV